MERLKEIVKELVDFRLAIEAPYDMNTLLDCATRIFISENIAKEKNGNSKSMSVYASNPSDEATPKQVGLMRQLGIFKEGMKKSEASAAIKAVLGDK